MKRRQFRISDVFVIGFAMFAVFFGAGNLIFPPFLGLASGKGWFTGFLCFVTADVGLAIFTMLLMVDPAILEAGGIKPLMRARFGK